MKPLAFLRPGLPAWFKTGRSALLLLPLLTPAAHAYDTYGYSWPSGNITFHVDLDGAGAAPLSGFAIDGATTWNEVFNAALGVWNNSLVRSQTVALSPTTTRAYDNGTNEVFWATDVYGDEWGDGVLGVTLLQSSDSNPAAMGETDIVFNRNGVNWNSYRGNLRVQSIDFRRVAIHELGHALGLGHPDQATPPQTVSAIMNSAVSNTDTVTSDDIEGVVELYGTPLVTPNITRGPLSRTVNVGDMVSFDFQLNGANPTGDALDPNLTYLWYFPQVNFSGWLFTMRQPSLFIGAAQPYDAGNYTIEVTNPDAHVTAAATLTVNPITTSPETKMGNLSTRGITGPGEKALTVGFVVDGTAKKKMLIRAIGPTLRDSFGLPEAIADPTLKLYRIANGTPTLIETDDNWGDGTPAETAAIVAVSTRVGAFTIPDASADSVLLVDLDPGVYSASVSNADNTEGVVIVEAYDADETSGGSRMVNLSSRGYVSTGNNILIAGLSVQGPGPRRYLIRAVGDTLQDYGVGGTLDDTYLKVFSGQTPIRIVDDWDDPYVHQSMLRSAMTQLGAFPLTDRQESAVVLTLYPGQYSVQISGFGDAQGIALVEIYDYPDA